MHQIVVLLLTLVLEICTLAVAHAVVADAIVPRERIDRGLIARPTDDGKVYLGWRLLASDPAGTAFNVYRRIGQTAPVKLNERPIDKTTDFVDSSASKGIEQAWFVRAVVAANEGEPSPEATATPGEKPLPYVAVKLQGDYTFQKIGIADLDGDARYDYVIKQPDANVDPYENYWKPSPGTFKLEAYRHDGRLLWIHDLGWSIEQGIWYSPYIVYDLDGKAEVVAKTGEGDPRDKDGRVQSGPEHLTVFDGLSGKPITRIDWPARGDFNSYNYASRNQLHVAYLDGKTPSLIVNRGTYNLIKLVAYQYRDGQLREQWRWDNTKEPRKYWGQGAHWMHTADIDGDGRDEIAVGSFIIDDNGKALWSTGLGHPDHFYLGDIDPSRPGLEIYFGIEPRSKRNAMCLVDAKTGEILWGHDEPTQHIHSSGLCSDIDASHPGSECYSGERDFEDKRWLRDCKGNVLSTKDLGGLSPRSAYWDADVQRELVRGQQIGDYAGDAMPPKLQGRVVAVADILGDWREEIIMSTPGEMRIYTTTIPAADRRACLMQDPIYRMDVVGAAMGYYQVPMTSYDLTTGPR